MHDFAITKSFIVVLDLPVVFDKKNIFKGNTMFQWDPARPARLGVVRRSALTDRTVDVSPNNKVRSADDHDVAALRQVPVEWFSVPHRFAFHVVNAYEETGTSAIVVDVVAYPGDRVDLDLARFAANGGSDGRLTRWRVQRGEAAATEELLLPQHSFEFPVINPAKCGLQHRFAYFATSSFPSAPTKGGDFQFRGMTKYDARAPERPVEWRTDDGEHNDEFIFVGRLGAKSEDDGFLVGYTTLADVITSHLVILDAITMTLLCRLLLPQRVPHGFHGTWVPAEKDQ